MSDSDNKTNDPHRDNHDKRSDTLSASTVSQRQLLDDLDFAAALAKDGASTPLLGGPMGLMWGIMLFAVFFLQWAILTQTLPVDQSNIAFLWVGFSTIGGIGSIIHNKNLKNRDGINSMPNKVEKYVWLMFSIMLISLFTGILANILFLDGSFILFGVMVAAGFAGQGLAYGLIAVISKLKWLRIISIISFVMAAICLALYNTVTVYLIGSIASLITVALPSLICMKIERKNG
jgi:hypothetical protein